MQNHEMIHLSAFTEASLRGNRYRRLLCALLAGALLLGMCACAAPGGADPLPSPTAPTGSAAASETTGQPTSEPPVPTETEDPMEIRLSSILDSMTMEEKLCQLFIVTPEALGAELDAGGLDAYPVGGLIFFGYHLQDRDQVTRMLQSCRTACAIAPFLSVDEEGGIVSRVGSNPDMGVGPYPAMADIPDEAAAYAIGRTIGSDLLELGFNLDFAPVADVDSNPDNPVIGSRAFRSDADETAALVASCVEGYRDAGMISCIKHFPGHGDTAEDSHHGGAASFKTMDQLRSFEFLPFRAGIASGAPLVMVGHINLPNVINEEVPASLSAYWIQTVLREELGFDGVIITDSLAMGAITQLSQEPGGSALLAFQAGADLLLMPDSLPDALEQLQGALDSGSITEKRINESVLRILRLKLEYGILN